MMTIEILTVSEQNELSRLEERIALSFYEAGRALAAIRDRKLYRATHSSFEAYCDGRWKFSRQQAYRLIDAAEVAEDLSPIGDTGTPQPVNEAQCRSLTPLAPEQRREAWVEAVNSAEGDRPTAAEVKQAVDRLQRRNNALTPGSRALVVAGEHKGKEVVVGKVENGAIAHSALPDEGSYPFMVGELEVVELAPAPEPAPKKPSLKDECDALKSLLRQVYEAFVDDRELDEDLVVAIERALA